MALLRLNVGGVHLNPSLPTFLSPGVLGFLMRGCKVTPVAAPRRSVGILLGRWCMCFRGGVRGGGPLGQSRTCEVMGTTTNGAARSVTPLLCPIFLGWLWVGLRSLKWSGLVLPVRLQPPIPRRPPTLSLALRLVRVGAIRCRTLQCSIRLLGGLSNHVYSGQEAVGYRYETLISIFHA